MCKHFSHNQLHSFSAIYRGYRLHLKLDQGGPFRGSVENYPNFKRNDHLVSLVAMIVRRRVHPGKINMLNPKHGGLGR